MPDDIARPVDPPLEKRQASVKRPSTRQKSTQHGAEDGRTAMSLFCGFRLGGFRYLTAAEEGNATGDDKEAPTSGSAGKGAAEPLLAILKSVLNKQLELQAELVPTESKPFTVSSKDKDSPLPTPARKVINTVSLFLTEDPHIREIKIGGNAIDKAMDSASGTITAASTQAADAGTTLTGIKIANGQMLISLPSVLIEVEVPYTATVQWNRMLGFVKIPVFKQRDKYLMKLQVGSADVPGMIERFLNSLSATSDEPDGGNATQGSEEEI